MSLSIGDKVRYLNHIGGGVVKRIIDKQMIEVLDESGFEIPVLKTEVVKVDDSALEKSVPQPKAVDQKKAITENVSAVSKLDVTEIAGNDQPTLLLAIVPESKALENFDIYLINDCNYHFLFTFSEKRDKLYHVKHIGTLESNTKELMGTYTRVELQSLGHFFTQGVFFKRKGFDKQSAVQQESGISPMKLFKEGCFGENDYFEEPALIISVYEKNSDDYLKNLDSKSLQQAMIDKEMQAIKLRQLSKQENKELRNSVKEVDLHIHELVENEAGMSPGDKLNVQLETFERELNKAILERAHKVVFIHGHGQGVLKLRIRQILEQKYPKLKFQDASFEKYKFGATMVLL